MITLDMSQPAAAQTPAAGLTIEIFYVGPYASLPAIREIACKHGELMTWEEIYDFIEEINRHP